MKKIFLAISLVIAAVLTSFAQCDQKQVFISQKTSHIEGDILQRVDDETTRLEINKSAILLTVNGEQKGVMQILSQACNWSVPFKEGKSKFKLSMDGAEFTVVIEGKDGKVTTRAFNNNAPEHVISLVAEKFEAIE